jgi:hypothetical protein
MGVINLLTTVISKTPRYNGAHDNFTTENPPIPDGYIAVPSDLLTEWQQYAPFVALTIEDGVIVAISDNPDARAVQAFIDAETKVNAPLDMLTQLQLALAELAEAQAADQTATELALIELAELITGGDS